MPLSSFKNRCSLAVVILLLFCVSSFPRASYPQEQGKTEDKGKKVLKKIGKKLEEERLLTLLAAGFAFFGAKRTLDVYKQKEKGDSILPIFKIDADYQKLTQDIQGYHLGGELGIAFIGGDAEYTRYFENNPSRQFEILSAHFLYRMAWIKEAQINIAIGWKQFSNAYQNESVDLGVPLYLFPTKHWTVEAKPFFAFNGDRVLYDLQAALRYKVRYLGARAGYRFIRASTQDWHGPQAGLFLEW